jgi:hypothetical protein
MINFISHKVVLSNTKSMAVNRLLTYSSYSSARILGLPT